MTTREPSTALPKDPEVIALLEAAGVWMWETNLAQETTTFQHGFWEQYGYETDAVEETFEFIRLVEREDIPGIVSAWRAHLEDGAPLYESEWRLRLPNGSHRWIRARGKVYERDANGKASLLVGIYRDITDERASELELRTSAAELDAVFRGAPHGLALVGPDMRLVRFNDKANEIIRLFAPSDLRIGFHILDLPPVEENRPVIEDIRKVLAGASVPDRTIYLPASAQYLEVTYAAVDGITGGIAGAVISLRNVTDRVRSEQTRAQAMRLESMGLMASGVAHDFNNLLSAIVGNIDFARDDVRNLDAAEGLSDARSAAMRASEMVNQLLSFAGQTEPVSGSVDISSLAAEIARYARRMPGATATISEELAPNLPEVSADASQLRQVVLNLVVNALDATRERGSTVTVRTRLVDAIEPSGGPVLEGKKAGRYLVLEVEDDGPGMDEPTRHRIFDPFFTTKPNGHGLGLASVLGAVRGHEGTLTVRSEPGSGATFTVDLPLPD